MVQFALLLWSFCLILLQDEHEAKARAERAKMEEDILQIQAELEAQRCIHFMAKNPFFLMLISHSI
jgi:hypothetical protein